MEAQQRLQAECCVVDISHLLNRDPHFDFDALMVPVPPVVQDNLARWVYHVDALVAKFAPEDNTVVIVAGEVSADGDDEEDAK